jgi:hypothetical protein
MNKLNQTEPALFSVFTVLDFLWDSYFFYFIATSTVFVRVEVAKSRPVHSIGDVIFPILMDRSARQYCCDCVFVFFFVFFNFLTIS